MTAIWGPPELERLKSLWGAGHSASQIAEQFADGRTRNSIIGKVHALKLPSRANLGREPTISKADALAAVAEKRDRGLLTGVRKAYASLGDDVTLSRFVKVAGEHKQQPRKQWALPGMDKPNPSIEAGRSIFHRRGVKPPHLAGNVLVSGHSNVKIGRDVRKGPLRGYWIYTLSLEERATCPRACHHWRTCYGNNMPYSKRVDHRDRAELEAAIERDIVRLLSVKGRVGILVRLHALGDFFSVDYVNFWIRMLHEHPRLAVYGYTAWHRDKDDIGRAIAAAKARHGQRFAVRWSNGGRASDCTVPIRSIDQAVNATVCPEQTGRTAACATCGLCWHSQRNIAFLEH